MSDCCCVEGGYGEFGSCVTVRVIKARKKHECCECKGPILRGEKHEIVTGKWEGEWYEFRTCAACLECIRLWACGGRDIGAFWEGMRECDVNLSELDKLSALAREKFSEQIEGGR